MSNRNIVNDTPSEVVKALREELNKVVTDLETLRAAVSAHTHSGVTTGGGSTGALATVSSLTAVGIDVRT